MKKKKTEHEFEEEGSRQSCDLEGRSGGREIAVVVVGEG